MKVANLTVKHFRQNLGCKVRVLHSRVSTTDGKLYPISTFKETGRQKEINAFGGQTVIQLTTKEGVNLEATSKCSPKDQFNRKFGVLKALGKLSGQLEAI